MPAALVKVVGRLVLGVFYRVDVRGLEHADPLAERTLIIANHTSLLDGVLLYLYLPRTPVFAIQSTWLRRWYLRAFLRIADLLPVDIDDPMAVKPMVQTLRERGCLVMFPEGRLTRTGTLMKVYEGAGVVADKAEAVILPIGIDGLQHSVFACRAGALARKLRPTVRISVLPPVAMALPATLRGADRRAAATTQIAQIMQRIAYANLLHEGTIFEALLDARRLYGASRTVAEDMQRKPITLRLLITRAYALGRCIARQTSAGENVGILLPNTTGVLTVFMAVQGCGRVPAMLNFTAGLLALGTAIETAQIKVIYTARRFVEQAGLGELVEALAAKSRIVYLEDIAAKLSILSRLRALVAGWMPRFTYRLRVRSRNPHATGVILFTSGSEGVPKGVVLSHRNILSNCAQTQSRIGLHQRDLVFNALPVFHSFGMTAGMMLPMLYGARTFFYPTPLHYRIIPELCYQLGATVLFGTNTFLAAYAQHAHAYDFHTLRFVIAGAEKLQAETRRRWAERFGIRILEGYGATEASPVVSVNTPMANKAGTVGQMLAEMEYYLEPVEGFAQGGRLVIRGPNVMRGYLYHGSDGEMIPPVTHRGPGWYDTGDIVDVDGDGYVQIVGRAKRFAKIGGEMISLAVVEEIAAAAWPGAVHAAVAIPDAKKGEIVVLVTQQRDADRKGFLEQSQRMGASELHVPRQFMVVDALPLLGTGKLDYRGVSELARRAA